MREQSKPATLMVFLNADFRDYQGIPEVDENPDNAILMFTYAKLLETCGWKITHLTDCPLSTEIFTGNMVNRMHDKSFTQRSFRLSGAFNNGSLSILFEWLNIGKVMNCCK